MPRTQPRLAPFLPIPMPTISAPSRFKASWGGSACSIPIFFPRAPPVTGGSGDLLEVAVLGVCGRQVVLFPEISDGDRILVQADIQIPSRFGQSRGLDGRPLPKNENELPAVQAIAKTITRLGE
jgi:hypothetical protein